MVSELNYNKHLPESHKCLTFLKVSCLIQVLGADLAILDEIDSGLDVDALRDVGKAVNGLLSPKNSVLMITHYLRLLEFINPTYIHIMVSKWLLN